MVTRREVIRIGALAMGGAFLGGKERPVVAEAKRSSANNGRQFRAGAATVDITPDPDVPLRGPIMLGGLAKPVHDRLHARALVLDDAEIRIAIVVCDVTVISRLVCDKAKGLIEQRVGIASDRILIAATHTHMSVRATEDLGLGEAREAHERYKERLSAWIADAVEKAVKNLAPAKVGWSVGYKPEHCRNRRWIMKPGTIGPNPYGAMGDKAKMYGGPGKNALRPAGPVDPELSVLSIQYADGRPMALLANFSIHYGLSGSHVSADYFGHFARRVEELLGRDDSRPSMVGIMSNGTSGDIAPGGEPVKLANSLAEEALQVCKGIKHYDWVPLVMEESELEVGLRLPDEKRLEWARQVMAGTWNKPAHRWSKIYARNALIMADWPPTRKLKFQAMRIGQLGIAAVPTETYVETGLAIKKNSPLKPTFTIELANGYAGYLPTPDQHKLGGYTTWPTTSSCLQINAEPRIRAEVLRLLRTIALATSRS